MGILGVRVANEWTLAAVPAVECPTCQARPGSPCTVLWGRPCETHATRIVLAESAPPEGPDVVR